MGPEVPSFGTAKLPAPGGPDPTFPPIVPPDSPPAPSPLPEPDPLEPDREPQPV